jgi:hypothetical protein
VKRFEKKNDFLTSTQDGPKPSSLWNQPSPSTGYFSVHGPAVSTPAHLSSQPAPAKSPAGQPFPHVAQLRRATQLASLLSACDTAAQKDGPVTLPGIGAVKPGSNTPVSPQPEFIPAQCSSQPEFHPLFNSITIRCALFELVIELSSSSRPL